MKTTVIHHSADYDGIFCREIARKFLPDTELIGWDFGQPLIEVPHDAKLYLLDLPPDCILGSFPEKFIWIDHHKSSIEKWTPDFGTAIEGYRIDGVAACRLAWQWFSNPTPFEDRLPTKPEFLARKVSEPIAVTLAGEYDVWQHENSDGLDVTFQFGLDCVSQIDWRTLLSIGNESVKYTAHLVSMGEAAQQCYKKRDADIVRTRSFEVQFEGLNFIALNTARCNSQTFEAAIKSEHDGCLAFYWNGKTFVVSMYGVPHKPDVDLSLIAVKHGGGGHRQACGFQATTLPWLVVP